ncbi:MAG: ribose-5-phosphate isomerase RpiA [Polyangiaceae bacterium]|nr:ribose-5-phosphate isomerase RpiA [Polyangiaceae bacterium]
MRLGLGTGRAAEAFIRRLGKAVASGLDVTCVPTSERSDALGKELGIRIVTLEDVTALDVAFDGADEVAPDGALVKGKGGAMLRERVVAKLASRFVVLVTPDKLVQKLGEKCPLPVEVVPFALPAVRRSLEAFGNPVLRVAGSGSYRTDNGNAVLDVAPSGGHFQSAREVDAKVRALPGVVDTGFFFDMATLVLVGEAGGAREIRPGS